MHLISANGSKVLLDCGLFQGKRAESYERNRSFPFDPASLDALILSHAHADHAGNIPNLVKSGFRGPIFATHATVDLCKLMLLDTAHLQERDIEFLNKRHRARHEPPIEPLYTVADVEQALDQFVGVSYGMPIGVVPGVVVRFVDAGHILGSAVTALEIDRGGKPFTIGFTGDLGRKNMPILRDPVPLGAADVLITESTYGGKLHEPLDGMAESLATVVRRTVQRGGKTLIPAFSVGKTQALIYTLFELFDAGAIPTVPIYIDSPLAVNATDIFRAHPECFDAEMREHLRRHEDPFRFGRLNYVRSVDESKALNDRKEPSIIVAGSGMCEGGRILHHLANNVEDSRTTILIIGYMAEHTLGRRIVERHPEIRIFGEFYKLKAEVVVLESFSAHADQRELVEYASALRQGRPRDIFLVHGEVEQAQALQQQLHASGFRNIHIPQRGDRVEYR